MVKKIISVLLGTAIVLSFAACANRRDSTSDDRVNVSVSFNALYEFAAAVGGDKVSISVIIPDGTEPHSFEPKAQDLAALKEADIFVINGLDMEAWAENAVKASGNTGLIVVDTSVGVDALSTEEVHHDDHDDENENENRHEHGAYDPHIWLSPLNAAQMAGNIRDALKKADPDNNTYYDANYKSFADSLDNLYTEYSGKFQTVENRSFVAGHAAFAYLCRDFGLLQSSVEDVFAEGEPTALQLTALVDYCLEHNVTTIFSEALVSAAVAETLASEVGAVVKPLYTMAGAENGKSYLERMEENLRIIYESLN